MNKKLLGTLLLGSVFCIGLPSAVAQSSSTDPGFKQDMKNAGTHAENAAKDAGHGVKSGTKKTAHHIKHGTKKATHKVAHKTSQGAQKVEHKTQPNQ